MKKKSQSLITTLGLSGEDLDSETVERTAPSAEEILKALVTTIRKLVDDHQDLNTLLGNETWLQAVEWLADRKELAETIREWFTSPLATRMAAVCVAGSWTRAGFRPEHWLALLRNAVLDSESGQWVSVLSSRTLRELNDKESVPHHLQMIARQLSDWHRSELSTSLERLLDEVPDEAVERQIVVLPLECLSGASDSLSLPQMAAKPNIARLLGRISQHRKVTVDRKLVETFGRILNHDPASLDRAYHSETLVETMAGHLSRPRNRSFILVGPSGVGKTAAIRELGRKLAEENPPILMLEASTLDVMAGTRWLGEWQTRLRELVEAIQAPKRIVWYVPDIVNIFTAGRSSNSMENFADYLIPFVEKGQVVIIGETTPEAFRAQIESVPAARQAFPVVRMNEPPPALSRRIVERVREEIQAQCRAEGRTLRLDDETLGGLIEAADRYFWGVGLPGRQVRLLREVTTAKIQESDGDELRVDRLDTLSLVAARTGIPRKLVDDRIPLDLAAVADFFGERVLGQPSALEAVVDRIALIKAGLLREDKPLGVFFFVGPTGVGKTEMAKALAEFLFGSTERLVRVDMSEFMDYSSFEKLIGNPRDRSFTPSVLARLRQQPFSVVLLDEFEKAHPNVFDLFLQVFDNGRLTDAVGETTDFRQTIIIMTSNLGSRLQSSPPPGFAGDPESISGARIQREMERFFRPEFINRLDQVVTFEPIDYQVMERLARKEIDALIGRGERFRRNVLLEIEPSAMALVLKRGFSPVYGARPLKRQVEQLLAAPLARRLVGMSAEDEGLLILSAEGDSIRIDTVSLAVEAPADSAEGAVVPARQAGGRGLSLPQCRRLLAELESRFQGLTAEYRSTLERMRETRDRHLAKAGDSAFWEDNLEARRRLSLARHQEFTLGEVAQAETDLTEIGQRLAPGQSVSKSATLHLGGRLGSLPPRLNQIEVALRRCGALDHHDVFISAQLLGRPVMEEDPCDSLLKMYMGWLSHRNAKFRLIDQRWTVGGIRESWILHAQGNTLYGWLSAETGLHRFVHEPTSSLAQRVSVARVEVLPDPEREDFKAGEVKRESQPPASKPSGDPFASSLSLVHLPTLTMVQGQNDETPAESEKFLRDLLNVRAAIARGDLGFKEERLRTVIRHYTLSPSPLVRDPLTKTRSGRLQAVLSGQIEDFLLARVRAGAAG